MGRIVNILRSSFYGPVTQCPNSVSNDTIREILTAEVKLGILDDTPLAVTTLIDRGTDSWLCRVESESLAHPIIVKRMPPQSFALQLEGLRLGEKALANSERYGVPRCISALPDRSILILEWIDGTSLADCLVSHATTLDTKLMMIGHAAEWLYEFHKLTRTGSELPDIDKRLGKLERSVEKVSKNHYIPKMIREAHRFLLDTARIAEKTKCTVSLTHGDFKPQNVIICEDKTFGIDPYSSHTGLALIDVAHFCGATITSGYTARGLRTGTWLRRYKLADHFLSHYFALAAEAPSFIMNWLLVEDSIITWCYGAERLAPLRSSYHTILKSRELRNLLNKFQG